MSTIDRMIIADVETEYGFRSFVVDADTLRIYFPDEYKPEFSQEQFFFLACKYLEEYGDDVVSTESSKLDYFV